ncbi:DMT family transporter [Streptomyces tricolor]|nr:DMT family transporter [Streptomyces tricolor]
MTARGWFLFSLMGVVWGIPYLMIKVAVDAVSPPVVVFTRCALGALLLLPFALRQGGFTAAILAHWRPLLAFALLEIMVPWFTLTDAERHLSSSTAGLLIAGVPIVGVVLARFLGDTEHLGVRRVTGLALGLAGVSVLTPPAPHRRRRPLPAGGPAHGPRLRHRTPDRGPPPQGGPVPPT